MYCGGAEYSPSSIDNYAPRYINLFEMVKVIELKLGSYKKTAIV